MVRSGFSSLAVPMALGLLLAGLAGCDDSSRGSRDAGGGGGDGSGPTGCVPGEPGVHCEGNAAVTCNGSGEVTDRTNCGDTGDVCVDGTGCTTCRPGSYQCDGDSIQVCSDDGTSWMPHATCDPSAGESCNAATGTCTNACDAAAASNSYIGCEYFPTPAINGVYEGFDFAVVVANPQDEQVSVEVSRGGSSVTSTTIPAGGLETIRLEWVDAIKSPAVPDADDIPRARSALVRGAAYELTSTLPVTVYQFNPLEYRTDGDCPEGTDPDTTDGACYSYTNDASLLLPSHVLTGNYIGVARATRHQKVTATDTFSGDVLQEAYTATPGYLAIVGAGEGSVDVTVELSAHIAASEDGAVGAASPGDTRTFSLGPGDVLQLASAEPPESSCSPNGSDSQTSLCGLSTCDVQYEYCAPLDDYDLTGTRITATGPVMVLGGHECAFVPNNRWACDHLEESVFPLESWGNDFIVSITEPIRDEPNLVRIVSGADNNEITFEPSSVHGSVTLNQGEQMEFEASDDFRVTGSEGAILVGQFLVGQDYAGFGSSGEMGQGDPAMSFAIPTDQFRDSYTVLAPETFETNYINVTAPDGVEVTLDGSSVSGWRNVGSTGMRTARVEVSGGTHTLSASEPFGVVVYGFGSYTSYMYPGGLDLEDINPLI